MHKKILLYYQYVQIDTPETLKKEQQELCLQLGLVGRIIVATEGINGTVCGTPEAADAYVAAMRNDARFASIDFKENLVDASYDYFKKLKVMVKPEIVSLGVDPNQLTPAQGGKHLTPQEVHELLQKKPDDLVILDTRNNYESRIGQFVGQISAPIDHFRDLPAYLDNHTELFKDKTVLMHCTGGVRCERATAYLKNKGIAKEVLQIQGGICRYVEQFPDGFFRGKNYVFDDRVSVPVNDDILTSCDWCHQPNDTYRNCANASCNKQFIGCQPCVEEGGNCCSTTCKDLLVAGSVQRRPAQQVLPITCTK